MALIKTGDWGKVNRMLRPGVLEKRINRFAAVGTNRVGALLVRRIRQQMRKTTIPNAPVTRRRKGSSRPLFDDGDLFSAVTYIQLAPTIVFAGIPNTSRDPESGISLAVIARVLEGGEVGKTPQTTIIVHKRAAALFIPLRKRIRPGDPGLKRGVDFVLAKQIRILPRPFIGPAVMKARKEVVAIYEKATRAAFLSLMR